MTRLFMVHVAALIVSALASVPALLGQDQADPAGAGQLLERSRLERPATLVLVRSLPPGSRAVVRRDTDGTDAVLVTPETTREDLATALGLLAVSRRSRLPPTEAPLNIMVPPQAPELPISDTIRVSMQRHLDGLQQAGTDTVPRLGRFRALRINVPLRVGP